MDSNESKILARFIYGLIWLAKIVLALGMGAVAMKLWGSWVTTAVVTTLMLYNHRIGPVIVALLLMLFMPSVPTLSVFIGTVVVILVHIGIEDHLGISNPDDFEISEGTIGFIVGLLVTLITKK